MGELRQFIYTNTGTEIEFMQGLIDIICSLDSGITCVDSNGNPTTAAEQFADLTGTSKAKFLFNFGNGITAFHLERGSTNNNTTSLYFVSNYQMAPGFSRNNYAVTAQATRSFNIGYYKSDNFVMFGIGPYDKTGFSQLYHSFGIIKYGTDRYLGITDNTGASILTASFTNNRMSITIPSIMPYSAGAGKIDYIDSMPAISSGTKQFNIEGILPCSTVSLYSSIALPNGKNYFAIGTNAMVDVTEDE